MTPFFTTTGDDGYTGLLGEGRVAKYSLRIEAVGDVDEATAAIGLARATAKTEETKQLLLHAQRDLYALMAEISATAENAARFRKIDQIKINWLETQTNQITDRVKVPSEFIIPGDSSAGAALSLARTIIRRAERRVAQIFHLGEVENPDLLIYLNRLSSLCFVLELFENQATGLSDTTLAKGK